MIDFKIIGDYELNQCVEIDNIIKTHWIAVNKSDTDNLDCYIYPIRNVDDVEAMPVPVNLNGNPRIRYNDEDAEYILYNLSDALAELELDYYTGKFLVGFVPNHYGSGDEFIKAVEYGSGATMMSLPPSFNAVTGPMYSPLVFQVNLIDQYNTGSNGEIVNTYASGSITNYEYRLISGYEEEGIVLDTDYTTLNFNSALYSGNLIVNNAGNENSIEVFSSLLTENWNTVTSTKLGTGYYGATVSFTSGKNKAYGILGFFALPCYIISSDSCIPVVCVNRKLRYVTTAVDVLDGTLVSQGKFRTYFVYTDTTNILASPITINIDYHVDLYDSEYNLLSKKHYTDTISSGSEDSTPGISYDWGDAIYAKVVIDKVTSPNLTDDIILGYKHKFEWAQKKIETPEFYWHSSNPISLQDTNYESTDIILYHTQADIESIGGISNQVIPSGGIKLDWDLTQSTNLEGYASDDNQGGDDPERKFLFYRITKDIINNSTAVRSGVIPFTSEYTQMLPATGLSSGKYYINLFYESHYIVMNGSISTANSSYFIPTMDLTMFSVSDLVFQGIPFDVVVKQYNSSGTLINRTEISSIIPNLSIADLDQVSWVDGAETAKVVYEKSGTQTGGYTLYGYPEDLTTAIKRPSLGAYQVKVPSWSVAYGRFLLGYSSISSGDTSPSNLLNAYLYQLSVNGTSVNGAIGSDEVGKYIYMGYSRINTTAPLTAYVRYRTNDNGTYSSWSSWINIANSDINSTRYVKIFQLTEDMSTKIIEIQMSDSKSVSDDF